MKIQLIYPESKLRCHRGGNFALTNTVILKLLKYINDLQDFSSKYLSLSCIYKRYRILTNCLNQELGLHCVKQAVINYLLLSGLTLDIIIVLVVTLYQLFLVSYQDTTP